MLLGDGSGERLNGAADVLNLGVESEEEIDRRRLPLLRDIEVDQLLDLPVTRNVSSRRHHHHHY